MVLTFYFCVLSYVHLQEVNYMAWWSFNVLVWFSHYYSSLAWCCKQVCDLLFFLMMQISSPWDLSLSLPPHSEMFLSRTQLPTSMSLSYSFLSSVVFFKCIALPVFLFAISMTCYILSFHSAINLSHDFWLLWCFCTILSICNFDDLLNIKKNGEYPEDLFIVL